MLWIPCSMIEWSRFHAAWRNGTLLNAGDFMQHDWMQWIPSAWLNAVDYLQHGPKHPDLMQWIFCSMSQYIPIECSGFYAAWPKTWRLDAVDSLLHDWMQCTLCSMAKSIPIECSGFHAASLNAVDSMHCDGMQCNPGSLVKCIPIECSQFHVLWLNAV